MTQKELGIFTTVLTGAPAPILAALLARSELGDGQVVLTCPSCGATAVVPPGDVCAGFIHTSSACPVFLMVQFGLEQFEVVGAEVLQ